MYVNKWPRKTTSKAGAQGQGRQQAAEATLLAAAGIQASKRGLHGHCRAAPDKAQRRCRAKTQATCSTAVAACSHRGSLFAFYFLCFYLPASFFSSSSFWPHSFILGVRGDKIGVCRGFCVSLFLCICVCVCLLASPAGVSHWVTSWPPKLAKFIAHNSHGPLRGADVADVRVHVVVDAAMRLPAI